MEVSTFFTRLLHAPKATTAPLDNLDDFDAAWESVVETLTSPDERQLSRGIHATDVPGNLKHIVDALVYEGNRADEDTTGACLEYFLRKDCLGKLEGLCVSDRPKGVNAEVLKAVNNLVVLLSERFLVHNAIHRPLRRLLRSCIGDEEEKIDGQARVLGAAAVEYFDEEVEENLVDLMCILCSRMRSYPPLLLIFFHDRGWLPQPSRVDSTHFEFLLFSYLLRYVHRDGRTGDFARAGLLFLFDIAFLDESGSPGVVDPLQEARDALAEYILKGDFADVMAAGLGATYSLLPSKLRVPSLAELEREDKLEDYESEVGTVYSLPTASEEAVHSQLDLLLRLFGFVQDILHRCRSLEEAAEVTEAGSTVGEAILDALQAVFVENVLYPSILECSPSDGSAVAVLAYLDVLFANLEEGPVLHRILDVLTDADATPTSPRKSRAQSPTSPTRAFSAATERFTLRDLLLDNFASASIASQTAALHLLQTLLSDNCRHITQSLLSVIPKANATALARPPLPLPGTPFDFRPRPVNSTDVHQQEPELYSALVPGLDDAVQAMDDTSGFAPYLIDALAFLQADRCWQASRIPLQFVSEDGKPADVVVGEHEPTPNQHALSPTDRLVHEILNALCSWFASPPDTNIALTGALSALVRCPNRSLASWLLYDVPVQATSQKVSKADAETPRPPALDLPALYQVLRDLTRHVGRFRGSVPEFDNLLSHRRQTLLFAEHLEEAMSSIEADTPTPRKTLGESIKSFWSPRKPSIFGSPKQSEATLSPSPTPSKRGSVKSSILSSSHEVAVEVVQGVVSGPWVRTSDREDEKSVPLSHVLDNCIILEELVKELVGMITARRALGIDQVGFRL